AVHGVSPRSRRTIPAPSLNGRSTLPILPARSRNPGHAESSVTNRRRTIAEGGRPAARTMLRRADVWSRRAGDRRGAPASPRGPRAGGERPGPVVAARRPRGVAAERDGPRDAAAGHGRRRPVRRRLVLPLAGRRDGRRRR